MILVFNAGSSTLKYKLFGTQSGDVTCQGMIERIGEIGGGPSDYAGAIELVVEQLSAQANFGFANLNAIGHRVVHGGDRLEAVQLVTDANLKLIRDLLDETITLAPLHNPPAIQCLDAVLALAAGVPNALVFDTGFFKELPAAAYRYALPEWCHQQYKIRRYGAHGTSHRYVNQKATEILAAAGLPHERIITLHLGSGASAAAIRGGLPLDTSMGLTPLEGLVMGTRCGDIDPAIIPFLQRNANLSADEVDRLLNRESGLRGLCGDNDMRTVLRRSSGGDSTAMLALEIFCRRIRKYIGAYAAVLEGVDAIVFTAGVGEHSPEVRKLVCQPLRFLGIQVDENANLNNKTIFSLPESGVTLLTIPTDEERAIFKQTRSLVNSRSGKSGCLEGDVVS